MTYAQALAKLRSKGWTLTELHPTVGSTRVRVVTATPRALIVSLNSQGHAVAVLCSARRDH